MKLIACQLLSLFTLFLQAVLAEPKLHFIDVGEGDSILVECSKAPENSILIDAGSPLAGPTIVRFLQTRSIDRLQAFIATHPHLDHIGGIFTIAGLLKGIHFLDNGQDLEAIAQREDIYRWYLQYFRQRDNYRKLNIGDTLECDDATLKVLWPADSALGDDWNNNSIVIKFIYGKFSALLMGDALFDTEKILSMRQKYHLKSTVLKAGHHGSRFANSKEFIAAVAPELVVVSVDANNIRGYPDSRTISHLTQVSKTLITNAVGTITVLPKRDGTFTVKTEKSE